MIAQAQAELLEICTTRTTIGLILGTLALILVFTSLTGLLTHAPGLFSEENQRQLHGISRPISELTSRSYR